MVKNLQGELADEYRRIHSRAGEDPGTAGDEAEEHWASILRNWLPPQYPIVTKGRLINAAGDVSPQVDVIILSPHYPRHLQSKKLYLAGGVVAAFECKLCVDRRGLRKTAANAVRVKRLYEPGRGNPYDELNQPIFTGLLSHSSWKREIGDALDDEVLKVARHPREMLDVVCIGDSATYLLQKELELVPHLRYQADEIEYYDELLREFDARGAIATRYMEFLEFAETDTRIDGTPLGALVATTIIRLARNDRLIWPLAGYFQEVHSWGKIGRTSHWEPEVVRPRTLARYIERGPSEDPSNKWSRFASDGP